MIRKLGYGIPAIAFVVFFIYSIITGASMFTQNFIQGFLVGGFAWIMLIETIAKRGQK